MPNYNWPDPSNARSSASGSVAWTDSTKSSGRAKYPSDMNPKGFSLLSC